MAAPTEATAFDCPVCLEIMQVPVTLACGHTGCQPCLVEAVTSSKRCPVCRDKTTAEYVRRLRVSIFIQDMAAPHLEKQLRAEAELTQEQDRKRAAEDRKKSEKARAKKEAAKKAKARKKHDNKARSRTDEASIEAAIEEVARFDEEARLAARLQAQQRRKRARQPAGVERHTGRAWWSATPGNATPGELVKFMLAVAVVGIALCCEHGPVWCFLNRPASCVALCPVALCPVWRYLNRPASAGAAFAQADRVRRCRILLVFCRALAEGIVSLFVCLF